MDCGGAGGAWRLDRRNDLKKKHARRSVRRLCGARRGGPVGMTHLDDVIFNGYVSLTTLATANSSGILAGRHLVVHPARTPPGANPLTCGHGASVGKSFWQIVFAS